MSRRKTDRLPQSRHGREQCIRKNYQYNDAAAVATDDPRVADAVERHRLFLVQPERLGHGHGAMAATRAADGHRQVGLPFPLGAREEEAQEILEAVLPEAPQGRARGKPVGDRVRRDHRAGRPGRGAGGGRCAVDPGPVSLRRGAPAIQRTVSGR